MQPFKLSLYGYQMSHLEDHAPRRRRVLQLDAVTNPSQPHAFDRRGLGLVETDRASDERDANLWSCSLLGCLLRHDRYPLLPRAAARSPGCSSLPRSWRTAAESFNPINPAKVARTTLCEFAEPMDLVSTF